MTAGTYTSNRGHWPEGPFLSASPDDWIDWGGEVIAGNVTPAQVNLLIDFLIAPGMDPAGLTPFCQELVQKKGKNCMTEINPMADIHNHDSGRGSGNRSAVEK